MVRHSFYGGQRTRSYNHRPGAGGLCRHDNTCTSWNDSEYLRPAFSIRFEPTFSLIGAGLFSIIVVAALFSGWDTFTANISKLGPILVTLSLSLLIMGLLVAKASGLAWKEVKTVSIEAGLQNATVGIALASFVSTQSGGLSEMGLPSAVYGIVMYIVVAPFVFWYRKT